MAIINFDWNQSITNFDFLSDVVSLEIFALAFGIKTLQPEYPIFKSLVKNKKNKKLRIGRAFCSLKDYAFVEVLLGKGMRSISAKRSKDKCEKNY